VTDDDDDTDRYILDEHGHPVPCPDLLKWAMWMETNERRICLDMDEARDGGPRVRVSTVFLGVDYRLLPEQGPLPILWETMVFGGPLNGAQERYTSLEDALAGHQEMCQRVNAAMLPLKGTNGE